MSGPSVLSPFIYPLVLQNVFSGTGRGTICPLLYLLDKYKNACSYPVSSIAKGVIDIRWSGSEIRYPPHFISQKGNLISFNKDFLDLCVKEKKRFFITALSIFTKGGHSGSLIFDLKNKTVERFEPYGSILSQENKIFKIIDMDKQFDQDMKQIGYKYIKPDEFCPLHGPQALEESIEELLLPVQGDPKGYCIAWSIFYIDLRLYYPDMDRSELLKKLINDFQENKINFRRFIRNYINFVVKSDVCTSLGSASYRSK